MTTDINICACGWQETSLEESFTSCRRKCPKCGGSFFEREEIRWFMPQSGGGDD